MFFSQSISSPGATQGDCRSDIANIPCISLNWWLNCTRCSALAGALGFGDANSILRGGPDSYGLVSSDRDQRASDFPGYGDVSGVARRVAADQSVAAAGCEIGRCADSFAWTSGSLRENSRAD